jgi:hypothetical protein
MSTISALSALLRAAPGMLAGAYRGRNRRDELAREEDRYRQQMHQRALELALRKEQHKDVMAHNRNQLDYYRDRDKMVDTRQRELDAIEEQRRTEEALADAVAKGFTVGDDRARASYALPQVSAAMDVLAGGRGTRTVERPTVPRTAPFRARVGGVTVSADDMGPPSQTILGRQLLTYDPQRSANAAARLRAENAALKAAEQEAARDAAIASRTPPPAQLVTGADGKAYWADPRSHTITPATGPAGAFALQQSRGKPTEGEQKTAGYAQRMLTAERVLNGLKDRNVDGAPSRTQSILRAGGGPLPDAWAEGIANTMRSPEQQIYFNAALDLVAAFLRRDTGAAVRADEWYMYSPMFIDRPDDKPATRAQKAANRQAVTAGMIHQAGSGWDPSLEQIAKDAADKTLQELDTTLPPWQRRKQP